MEILTKEILPFTIYKGTMDIVLIEIVDLIRNDGKKIRDNMIENVHEWTIGAIITVGTALLISIFRLG